MTESSAVYVIVSTASDHPLYMNSSRSWTRDPFEAWCFATPEIAQSWGMRFVFAGYRVACRTQWPPITTAQRTAPHDAFLQLPTTPPHT